MEDYFNWRRAPVNIAIVVVNVIYFFLVDLNGSVGNTENMIRWGAMFEPYVLERHEYWRMLTSVFMHFSISHIMNNMIVLCVLGDNLERALGHVKYLIFYLLCGIGANAVSMYVNAGAGRVTVGAGASGAIFGVIGGLIWAVIRNRGRLEDLTMRQLMVTAAFSLYFGFTSTGVDNAAHVGGLLIGFMLSLLFYRPRFVRSDQ